MRLLCAAPETRALVYLTALRTGLRRGELRQLEWRDVDLAGRSITVRASVSKSDKAATIPLAQSVVEGLKGHRRSADPAARVFDSIPAIKALRADLEAAGIEEETEEGIVDFHAFRTTFGTDLVRSGVLLPKAKELMRHNNVQMIMRYYVKLDMGDKLGAIEQLESYASGAATVPHLRHNAANTAQGANAGTHGKRAAAGQ